MAKTNVKVKLVGSRGNAFGVLGKVSKALRMNGHKDLIDEFMKEAMSGDYDHLLATAMDYVEVS